MRLVIERGELLRALGPRDQRRRAAHHHPDTVQRAAARRRNRRFEFKATDLEREVIEERRRRRSPTPGAVTVPAHMLHDIVRKLPDGAQIEITRDAEKERLTLTAGQSRFALQTLPAEDFPDSPSARWAHEFEIAAADLKRLIDKTRFAISTEETRYYLNGIYLHTARIAASRTTLRAVATDGHRLAQVELPLPKGADGMPGVIVPRKTVHELHRLIEDSSAPVKVGVSASQGAVRDRQP